MIDYRSDDDRARYERALERQKARLFWLAVENRQDSAVAYAPEVERAQRLMAADERRKVLAKARIAAYDARVRQIRRHRP